MCTKMRILKKKSSWNAKCHPSIRKLQIVCFQFDGRMMAEPLNKYRSRIYFNLMDTVSKIETLHFQNVLNACFKINVIRMTDLSHFYILNTLIRIRWAEKIPFKSKTQCFANPTNKLTPPTNKLCCFRTIIQYKGLVQAHNWNRRNAEPDEIHSPTFDFKNFSICIRTGGCQSKIK